jgi:hypothetical protein
VRSPTLAELQRSLHEKEPESGAIATVLVTDGDVSAALVTIRENRWISAVRVRLGDVVVGYLLRADAYPWFSPRLKDFGDYVTSVLPGPIRPGAFRLTRLACPQPGCPDNPVMTLAYDSGDPPRCRIHGTVLLPGGAS